MRALVFTLVLGGLAACLERSPYQADVELLAALGRDNRGVRDLLVVGGHLYWTEADWSTGNGSVWRMAKDGGDEPKDLLADVPATERAPFTLNPFRLAVDAEYVYWSNAGLPYATEKVAGQISRRRRDLSTPPETVAAIAPPASGGELDQASFPCGLAVDAEGVLWGTFNASTESGEVRYLPTSQIAPGAQPPPAGQALSANGGAPVKNATCAVALVGGRAWWVDQSGSLWGPAEPSGPVLTTPFATYAGGYEDTDGDQLDILRRRTVRLHDGVWYWSAGKNLVSVENQPGAPTSDQRAADDNHGDQIPEKLVAEGDDLYWITARQDDTGHEARLFHGELTLNNRKTALVDATPDALATDARYLYYAISNGIYRLER